MRLTTATSNINKCLYGSGTKVVDVTNMVTNALRVRGYIDVSNSNFGDPCYGIRKTLTVYTNDDEYSTQTVDESDILYSNEPPTSATTRDSYNHIIYYHIFCNVNTPAIFEDQVARMLSSPGLDKITAINCCVTGNDLNIYNAVIARLNTLGQQTASKIRIRKSAFNDTSFEKFTFYAIKEDLALATYDKRQTFITYIHTKGVTNTSLPVKSWRQCMEHFLISKADWCIHRLITEGADSAGCFFRRLISVPDHYSGNMWTARASHLSTLFTLHPHLGTDGITSTPRPVPNRLHRRRRPQILINRQATAAANYYAGEFFLFKVPHKHIVLYDTHLCLYLQQLPSNAYSS